MTRRRWTRAATLEERERLTLRERKRERARELWRKSRKRKKGREKEEEKKGRKKKQYGGKESPGKREPVVRGNPCVLPEKVHEPPDRNNLTQPRVNIATDP